MNSKYYTNAKRSKKLEARKTGILSGEVIVFAEDECHLVWGDTIGFVWGRRNERTEVPIINAKQRQTYYGVMNLANQEVTIAPHERGNGENTVAFIKQLQALYPNKKLIIIWDGVSYSVANYDLYMTQAKLAFFIINHKLMIKHAIECIVLN